MNVTATVKPESQPEQTMKWCTNGDETDVLLSVAQLLKHARDRGFLDTKIIEITIEL